MSNYIEGGICSVCKEQTTFFIYDYGWNRSGKECQKCLTIFDQKNDGQWIVKHKREAKEKK